MRLPEYDYRTPGAYFLTICTFSRAHLFEDPVLCELVREGWAALPMRFPTIRLDSFVVMPNHLHGIVWLALPEHRRHLDSLYSPRLSGIVRVLKSLVAVAYIRWVAQHDPNRSARVWQRNYYEHVIRDEHELEQIRHYIRDNPTRWAENRDNLDLLFKRMRPGEPP